MQASASRPSVIRIRGLEKSFGENHVLRGFDLDLAQGENLVVLGRSGSGKSVLIKCIIGLMQPDGGRLEVLGREIPDLDQRDLDKVRVKVGFLFQGAALYDSMTVRENLEFPLRRHRKSLSQGEVDKMVRRVLEGVGLLKAAELMPAELSGGMKKRIALARTLILEPEIILYDEPTGGLDPITAKEISNLIVQVQEEYRASAMIITHDLVCARITGNRIVVLVDGKNYACGSYQELNADPDPQVRAFFE